MAVSAPVIVGLIGAGATVYAASQQPKQPELPKLPDVPKLPATQSMAGTAQQADLKARSAGGTILSDQKANQQISDGANQVRKTLLGS